MKGKKSDYEFINQFIKNCVNEGIETSQEIIQHAKSLISNIEEEIKTIESKKIMRSKLLDVVNSFEKETKTKSADAKVLVFTSLPEPDICYIICKQIYSNNPQILALDISNEFIIEKRINIWDFNFAVKNLIKFQILESNNEELVPGIRFQEYMNFWRDRCQIQ